MNKQEFKVRQTVRVNEGAQTRDGGIEGEIIKIDNEYRYQPCILIKHSFKDGSGSYEVWAYPSPFNSMKFDVEILSEPS